MREGSLIGERGCLSVVVLAPRACERVVAAGIGLDGDLRMFIECLVNLLLRFRGAVLVLGRDVEQQWPTNHARLVQGSFDSHPVVTDGSLDIQPASSEIRKFSAETET